MKISRRVVAGDGTAKKEEKVLTINVKPGWKSGTKITFQREGDQGSAVSKIHPPSCFIYLNCCIFTFTFTDWKCLTLH